MMASIDGVVRNNFAPIGDDSNVQLLVSEIDGIIFKAGKMIEAILDYAMLPLDDIDNETIIGMSLGLLSLLGHSGPYIDALEQAAYKLDMMNLKKSH